MPGFRVSWRYYNYPVVLGKSEYCHSLHFVLPDIHQGELLFYIWWIGWGTDLSWCAPLSCLLRQLVPLGLGLGELLVQHSIVQILQYSTVQYSTCSYSCAASLLTADTAISSSSCCFLLVSTSSCWVSCSSCTLYSVFADFSSKY